jgi:hypothetical protein
MIYLILFVIFGLPAIWFVIAVHRAPYGREIAGIGFVRTDKDGRPL